MLKIILKDLFFRQIHFVWTIALFTAGLAAFSGIIRAQPAPSSSMNAAQVDKRVDALLARLTVDDKIKLMHTQGFLQTIPVLDFKPSTLNDGPMGVRNTVSTAFPSAICMGSTWDTNLIFQETAALGSEAKTYKNTLVQLGPMINLIRHPNGGRNFEMFSEDPFLVGSLGVAYVRGLQSENVGACPKHLACNEQETDRKGVDVQIDERTLHEVYLLPFEMNVKQADPWFMMTGYNKVNGVECYRNRHLLQDIARDQWHFQGAFCSDWTAVQDAVGAVNAGLNMDLNSVMAYTTKLPGLVKSGVISEVKIDELVRPILRAYVLSGLLDDGDRTGTIDTPEHQQLARQVAQEGIVVLKNKGILPLDLTSIHRIAVFGPNADTKNCPGGGSGGITPPYEITPLEGLRKLCGDKTEVVFQPFQDAVTPIPVEAFQHAENSQTVPGLSAQYYNGAISDAATPALSRIDPQLAFNWIDNSPAQGSVDAAAFSVSWQGDLVPPVDGSYTLSVAAKGNYSVSLDGRKIISTFPADHCDHQAARVKLTRGAAARLDVTFTKTKSDASFTLNWERPTSAVDAGKLAASADVAVVVVGTNHRDEAEGMDRSFWELPTGQADLIRTVSQANSRTIVVMVNGSPLEMASWQDSASAVVEMWYAGMEGGDALADILFGRVNPSGKLTVTIPRKIEDVGSNGHFATSKVVTLPEGIFVGYRHFDKEDIDPLYPFGFGLSYTTFGYDGLSVKPEGDGVTATFRVTNTGPRAGAEISEVYIGTAPGPVERPVRELEGFARTQLNPGETKTVTVPLSPRAFAFYDVDRKAWHVTKGTYRIQVGGSVRSLPLKAEITLPDSVLP
jgi:beta-glucosidase